MKGIIKKVSEIEKTNQNYLSRIENLEKRDKYTQIQSKLTNAPKLEVKHDHKEWIRTVCLIEGRCIITGSKDKSIKGIRFGDEDEDKDKTILFTIENAHNSDVNYIMKVNEKEIISCGDDGTIKRWNIDCSYYLDENKKRFGLLETFSIKKDSEVHESAYKIITLKNGNLCSCGKGSYIIFWKKKIT